MFKYQQDYQKVEALRAKNPRKATRDLIKMAKVSTSSYYRGKQESQGSSEPKRARKHTVIEAAAKSDNRLIFLMGTPDQIRSVLAGGAI